MKFLTSEWKIIINFLEHLYVFKYIAVVVNVATIQMYKSLCCCKHALYHQLCPCVISSVILGSSFNHFGPQFFLLNDRQVEYKMAEVFSSSDSVRLWCGSEGQERSLGDGVLKFWFTGWEEWPCRPRLNIMERILRNLSTDTSAYL